MTEATLTIDLFYEPKTPKDVDAAQSDLLNAWMGLRETCPALAQISDIDKIDWKLLAKSAKIRKDNQQ